MIDGGVVVVGVVVVVVVVIPGGRNTQKVIKNYLVISRAHVGGRHE